MSSDVEISIYNLLEQKVATLVSKKQSAGTYQVEWDAMDFVSCKYFGIQILNVLILLLSILLRIIHKHLFDVLFGLLISSSLYCLVRIQFDKHQHEVYNSCFFLLISLPLLGGDLKRENLFW